jgi:hypothetical protein
MTSDELDTKFRHNAKTLLSDRDTDIVVDLTHNLEAVDDVSTLMAVIRTASAGRKP